MVSCTVFAVHTDSVWVFKFVHSCAFSVLNAASDKDRGLSSLKMGILA